MGLGYCIVWLERTIREAFGDVLVDFTEHYFFVPGALKDRQNPELW